MRLIDKYFAKKPIFYSHKKVPIKITDKNGTVIFDKEIEAPDSWSEQAIQIVASKYLAKNEYSIFDMIKRVCMTISNYGLKHDYFDSNEDCDIFYNELKYILVNQMATFNSPVWFNCGVYNDAILSACFIGHVDDTLDSIMETGKLQSKIYKYGGGFGANYGTIRSSKESLSGGGKPSGAVSFMKIYDQIAGVTKSGGKSRRAAMMNILPDWYLDIFEFVESKINEEKKAHDLIECGYSAEFNYENNAYNQVLFQNSNFSVALTDEFMQAVKDDKDYVLHGTKDINITKVFRARELYDLICEGAWLCGDPGVFFVDTVNKYNPCINDGMINSSNPCGEFLFLDNSACNLSTINLMKFYDFNNNKFLYEDFEQVVNVMITAQDIIVDLSKYPSDEITSNSHKYRPLGLNYTNLAALMFRLGFSYGSKQSTNFTKDVTSFMTACSYNMSTKLANKLGSFEGFDNNKDNIVNKLRNYINKLDYLQLNTDLNNQSNILFNSVLNNIVENNYKLRNAQLTLLAPTGTTSFMLDAFSYGIEPILNFTINKKMVDGRSITIANPYVDELLDNLGYRFEKRKKINGIEGCISNNNYEELKNILNPEHINLFKTSYASNPEFILSYKDHLNVMSAAQLFLDGGISKTISLPNDCTAQDIGKVFMEAWEMGLKDVTVYRDGSKKTQPINLVNKNLINEATEIINSYSDLSHSNMEKELDNLQNNYKKEKETQETPITFTEEQWDLLKRKTELIKGTHKLPQTHNAICHKFEINQHKGYFHFGLNDHNEIKEVFINISKEGSTLSGLADAFAKLLSKFLQCGYSVKNIANDFIGLHFEPHGFVVTGIEGFNTCKSIIDYLFRWMVDYESSNKQIIKDTNEWLINGKDHKQIIKEVFNELEEKENNNQNNKTKQSKHNQPINRGIYCNKCGSELQGAGSCLTCPNCGESTGVCG